jgi:hypothetical protein
MVYHGVENLMVLSVNIFHQEQRYLFFSAIFEFWGGEMPRRNRVEKAIPQTIQSLVPLS